MTESEGLRMTEGRSVILNPSYVTLNEVKSLRTGCVKDLSSGQVDKVICAAIYSFAENTMDEESITIIINTLKHEKIDLVVTLPEEPTSPLTEAIRKDPYFTSITVVGEGHGISLCAGASISGRRCVFVTGIAGLMVGTWSLSQMGVLYGIPVLILASYRGDIADWGEAHLDFLRRFSDFHHGVPCADWLRALMNRVDPELFQACFRAWVAECFPDRLDPAAQERAAPEADGVLPHTKYLGDRGAGPAVERQQDRPRPIRLAAIPRRCQVLELRLLLLVRLHWRFARHAPPPRISAKTESQTRFVGQVAGIWRFL